MPAPFNKRWTDAMDDLLIEYWRDRHTATEIYRLGLFPGFTRNAIIGRLWRLRKKRGARTVSHRDSDPVPAPKKKRRPNYDPKEHAARPPTKIREPLIEQEPRWLTLFELGPHDCRYIVTPTMSHEYLYCALPAPDVDNFGNNCYCRFHQRIMRGPSPLRRL